MNSITVVLPAHNEEENIKSVVESCIQFFDKKELPYEIIVVNDGSSDGTATVVKSLIETNDNVILINHETNRGYGGALKSGLDNSTKEYLFYMDSDGQFDINDLDLFLSHISVENIVIGYRKDRADKFLRKLNTYLYKKYIQLIFGLKVVDIDCAFKLFSKKSYSDVRPIKSDGALFSAELLTKFKNSGYGFKELAVNHYPRKYGESSGANIGVIIKMFIESWKLRKEFY